MAAYTGRQALVLVVKTTAPKGPDQLGEGVANSPNIATLVVIDRGWFNARVNSK